MPKSPPNPSSIHQVESIQFVWSIASIHPKKRNIPYWYCLQCTPSLTLPPSSLKCLQNYNPNIHKECFRCFKCFGCFGCFISDLDHKTARFWSKSELNPQTAGIVPRHIMATENTQKGNPPTYGGASPTCLRRHTQFCPASYSRSRFWAKAALFSLPATKAGKHRRF